MARRHSRSDMGEGIPSQVNKFMDTAYDQVLLSAKVLETRIIMVDNAIDLLTGQVFVKVLTEPVTLSIMNPSPSGVVCGFTLELTDGATYGVTWFDGIRWDSGAAPALSAEDVLGFYSHDGGATWVGVHMFPGAVGIQGPAGVNGTDGATGATGATGAVGPSAVVLTAPENMSTGVLSALTTGSSNAFYGDYAGLVITQGVRNTAVGATALYSLTAGNRNTAAGFGALQNNTTGSDNTAIGFGTLIGNTTGVDNVAVGYQCLFENTTAWMNTGVGTSALRYNTTGEYNVAIGYNSLKNNTLGDNNTAIGTEALAWVTTGSGNIGIGGCTAEGTPLPVFGLSTGNNLISMGSTAVTAAHIQVAWTVVSDERDKTNFAPIPHGLEFVTKLKPTSFQFRTERESEETNGGVRYGFKAQDILALEGSNSVVIDADDPDKLRYNESSLIPILVQSIQELSEKYELLNEKFEAYVSTHP